MDITESSTIPAPDKRGHALIQIITPGTGSSGVYPAEVLEKAAENRIFPAGTLMFADHPTSSEDFERPERSIRDIAGVLTEDARWDGQALVANARLYEPWQKVITEMSDAIGVSIRATGTVHESDEEGRPVIASLDQGISVDFVTKAGRGGRVLEIYESAAPKVRVIEAHEPPSDQAGTTRKKENPPMGTIQIDEADHKRLTEKAGQVAAVEAARDAAIKERDEALAAIAEAHRQADAQAAARIIESAETTFTALERRGLMADLPTTDQGRLDIAAFEKQVKEAAAVKQEQDGVGRPTGLPAGEPKSNTMTEADLDAALGITMKEA